MTSNIDTKELTNFNTHADDWWNMQGSFKTLHTINPLRLKFIQEHTELTHKQVLDIGCGGGILTESLARCGAQVTGIDMAESVLAIAQKHAETENLTIDYQLITAEALAEQQHAHYDVITCLEMLEHVPNPQSIIQACVRLLKPNGTIFFSTINRNLKAYLFTILGAEYLLHWLPVGTHDYNKFIRPAELAQWLREAGIQLQQMRGISYQILNRSFYLSDNLDVNYLVVGQKYPEL